MTAYFNDSESFFVLIILKFEFNNISAAKVGIFLLTTKSFSHYFASAIRVLAVTGMK